jgi:hypothetical protein
VCLLVLRLVLDQSLCRRKFGSSAVILVLEVWLVLLLARNAFICVYLIRWLKLVACCPNKSSLVSRTNGHCLANFEACSLF